MTRDRGLRLLLLALAMIGGDVQAGGEEVRGILEAEKQAVLSSWISAPVIEVPYLEGSHFDRDEVLVRFDCARLEADLHAAQAQVAAESRNAAVQRELLEMGATGRADVDIATYKVRELRASVESIHEQQRGCELKAPFAGRVVEPLVRANETPQANAPLIHIVSDGALQLQMVVPSCWLAWLAPGSDFTFVVDETGDHLTAEVSRVSAAVDPVSQTVKVISRVTDVPPRVLPGMSGLARWHADDNHPTTSGSGVCRARTSA